MEFTPTLARLAFEKSSDAISQWDKDLVLTFANQAFADRIGIRKDLLIGKTIRELGQPEWVTALWIEKLKAVFETGQPLEHEFTFATATGEYILQSCLIPDLAADGSVQCVLAIGRDTAHQKKSEQAFRKGEKNSRRLADVIEKVPDPCVVLNRDYTIHLISDAYLKATLTERKHIEGRYMFDVFPDNPAAPDAHAVKNLRASLDQVRQTKKPHHMAIQHYDVPQPANLGGGFEEKYWSPINIPVLDEKGEIEFIIHRVLEVTKAVQKQGEIYDIAQQTETFAVTLEEAREKSEALEESKDLLRAVLDSSLYTVQVFKAERDETGKIIDFTWLMVNKRWKELYGDAVVGKSLLKENPGVLETGLFDQFVQVTETGTPVDYEQHYNHEQFNGWLHQTLVKMGDGFVMNTEDITEEKKIEQALQEYRELLQITTDNLVDMTQVFKAVRNEEGEIIDFIWILNNRASEKFFGGVIGKSLLTLNPGVVKEGIFETFKQVVETGVPDLSERHYVHEQFEGWFYQSTVKLHDGVATITTDITERKEAEREILHLKDEVAQRATDRYYTLFNSIDEGFCIIEMLYNEAGKAYDFRYVEVNPSFERQTGLKSAAGKTVGELTATEPYWIEQYDKVAQTGEALRFENFHKGTQHWYEVFASRVGNTENRQVAIVFNDITERKKAEEALRESEQRFRNLVESYAQVTWETNPLGEVEVDSPSWRIYTGQTFEEWIGYGWVNAVHPEDRVHAEEQWREFVASRSIADIQFRLKHAASGTYRWIQVRATPILDAAGHVVKWVGMNSDIQLQKEAEEHLRNFAQILEQEVVFRTDELIESKHLLQTVFDITLMGMAIMKAVRDEDGNILDFRIELINKELERETGRKDLVGKLYAAEYPGIKRTALYDTMLQVMETGQPRELEYFYSHDGFQKWFSSTFVRLHDGLVATNLDITKRKEAEAENLNLKLRQQKILLMAVLEAQEEERRRISVSLHNGVAQTLYATKMIVDELAEKVPAVYVHKLNNLLKDAINETRNVSHELVPSILNDFGLEQAIMEMCGRFKGGSLRLECEVEKFESDLEAYQELALYRISQELINNIINHSKATDAKILIYQEDELIYLKVRDNGIGIQEKSSAHKGIGLRSIKDTVKLLNGTYDVSIPPSGSGTQVIIAIPV
ncbi:PAS domain-containing protein [Pontibacter russatus]|uniref:PAS domain-containing protein n=1 Tax=Pontibacter russatus TaxID=2694929 RepID=UPI001379D5B1|nr:PAS domain-containing protein [Pontibacter russatus]